MLLVVGLFCESRTTTTVQLRLEKSFHNEGAHGFMLKTSWQLTTFLDNCVKQLTTFLDTHTLVT
jgi:hypothetical protein